MQPDQASDYVAGILQRSEVDFGSADDGSHRVLYGSAAVYVQFVGLGDDETTVALSATVLEQLDQDDEAKTLVEINRLNQENYFGKFVLYPQTIRVEYELLASKLQRDEFINALGTVARLADNTDDELQQTLGGMTWQQVQEESQENALDV